MSAIPTVSFDPPRSPGAPAADAVPGARLLPLLRGRGVVQEWFEGDGAGALMVFASLAAGGVAEDVVWIGAGCRPYGRGLSAAVARRSLWVGADSVDERLWALETVLTPARRAADAGERVAASVLADGTGFGRVETRRLQLLAAGTGVRLVLRRPIDERGGLSTAGLRWSIAPAPSPTSRPRFAVSLLRKKTQASSSREPRRPAAQGGATQEGAAQTRRDAAAHGTSANTSARAVLASLDTERLRLRICDAGADAPVREGDRVVIECGAPHGPRGRRGLRATGDGPRRTARLTDTLLSDALLHDVRGAG